jgi:hypothetical protein
VHVVHEARTPSERARLRAVADATAHVRPPGIVRVVDVEDGDDALTVTIDAPDGPALDGQDVERAMFAALAAALAGLHGRGIAHGDVRAATIVLDGAGRPVLPLPRWRDGRTPSVDDDVAALAALVGDTRATSAAAVAAALAGETAPLFGRRHRSRVTVAAASVAAVVATAIAAVATTRAPHAPSAPTAPPPTSPATSDRIVTVDGRRYVVGEAGDLVVSGAWACGERRPTPAVIRPRTGDVFVFHRTGPDARATHVTRLDGVTAAGRRAATTQCDLLVVDTRRGPVTVALRRPRWARDGAAPRPRSPATDRRP